MHAGYSGYPSQAVFNPDRRQEIRYVFKAVDWKCKHYRVVKETYFAPHHCFEEIIGQSIDAEAAKAIWRLCLIDV